MSEEILTINNLKTYFYVEDRIVKAVDGVDLHVKKGETLGVVGESGSGKSITAFSILQLIPSPPGKIVEGEILFKGKDLTKLSNNEIRKIRGKEISMIFQEPMTSLNPVYTVGEQIVEAMRLHLKLSKREATAEAIEMLKLVGIPSPEKRFYSYPHQLSGGMRQRIMIAMALSCRPELLIADEPTTALDVTTQAQILDLIRELREQFGTSIILITHDLGVVAEAVDHVVVMYAGKVMEYADVRSFFREPKHPYSVGLLNSMPTLEYDKDRLEPIDGTVPSPVDMPEGCRFCTRCKEARKICVMEEPDLIDLAGRKVRCWKYTDRWNETGE